MKFEDSSAAVAVNSAHGIYIAQKFAEYYKDALLANKFDRIKLDILLAGPDHEDYLEEYADLFPITLKDLVGTEFVFDSIGEDSDIWCLPKTEYDLIEWEEI